MYIRADHAEAQPYIASNSFYSNKANGFSSLVNGLGAPTCYILGYKVLLEYNFFVNEDNYYELAFDSNYFANSALDATNNYWGTTDPAQISLFIHSMTIMTIRKSEHTLSLQTSTTIF
jgi:hypothetical protein